jgi:DNA-binding transcriptional MerR regulator/methylmalonyl-CoA mutase cobalamin-binding subunit
VSRRTSASARYPIRAAAKLTGITIDTLRAWERRHGAVTPVRDGRGRIYQQADIDRLHLLRAAVANGHGIGRLAVLSDRQLRHLAEPSAPAAVAAVRPGSTVDTSAISAAIADYDAAGVDREIAHLAAVMSPLALLRDVLMPVLVEVGDDWHSGRLGMPHERLMSSTVRNLLGSFLRLHSRAAAPARLLFATPAGDRHEIGTLGAAMLAASSGLGVVYLGPDLPAAELLKSVKPAGARVLVLGLTTSTSAKATEGELRTILRRLPKDVELWVGGPRARRHAALVGKRGLILSDYDAFQKELVRLGGHAQ